MHYKKPSMEIIEGFLLNKFSIVLEHLIETYEYDYLGNRTAKTSNGATTEYTTDLSSGYSHVLKAKTGTSAVYYTRGFELISKQEGSSASYYLYDGGLSVRALTNESGAVTDTLIFDAFGNETAKTGSTDNSYGFQGEEKDETGLYYLRARYMDPATGTFTSMDTYGGSLTDPMSLHKYLFANSNPVMYSDPSGHMSKAESVAVITVMSVLAAEMSGILYVFKLDDSDTYLSENNFYKGLWQSMLLEFCISFISGLIIWWLGPLALLLAGIVGMCASVGEIWHGVVDIIENNKKSGVMEIAFGVIGMAFSALSIYYGIKGLAASNKAKTSLKVSDKKLKHVHNLHDPHKVAEQLRNGGQYNPKKTYFNKDWSNQMIDDAVNYAYNEAVKNGVTKGHYTANYNGDAVTVYMDNGQFKTAYGNYNYSLNDLLNLH